MKGAGGGEGGETGMVCKIKKKKDCFKERKIKKYILRVALASLFCSVDGEGL